MEYFEKEFLIASDSDLDEIRRLSKILKSHKVEMKVSKTSWSKKTNMEMRSIGALQSWFYDRVEVCDINLEKHNFHVRLETGKNTYSIGILKGYQINFENRDYYTRVSMRVKFDTPTGEKVIKRIVDNCTILSADTDLRFITPTPKEVRTMKEHLCAVKTNKFGRDMTVGTLVVAWNSSTKQMYYGRITKMLMAYFEYTIPDGTIKRCYNPNMVYVPDDQAEFEFELTMEILKA